MAGKVRKDNKGRGLNNGEYQDSKTGRYSYQYQDARGKAQRIYSWTLRPSDPWPKGKALDKCLREKIQEVTKDTLDGIASAGKDMTVFALCERYTAIRSRAVRENTRVGYKTVLNILAKDEFGKRRVDQVTMSDAKEWLIRLQEVDKRSYSSIHNIRGVVRPAFRSAVRDQYIRLNPFDFELVEVVVKDTVRRDALSRKDMRRFLKFVHEDKHFSMYFEGMFILFNTGLRISEFCGLTAEDIDFENHVIRVEKQLLRSRNMKYYLELPKTESGKRLVPMSPDVETCFRKVIDKRPKLKKEVVAWDSKHQHCASGFLFLDKNTKPMVAQHWENHFRWAVKKHNRTYKGELPTAISPHVARHTYCSCRAHEGMNPKTLQKIMGHSSISMTMDWYTHVEVDDLTTEARNLMTKNSELYKLEK